MLMPEQNYLSVLIRCLFPSYIHKIKLEKKSLYVLPWVTTYYYADKSGK